MCDGGSAVLPQARSAGARMPPRMLHRRGEGMCGGSRCWDPAGTDPPQNRKKTRIPVTPKSMVGKQSQFNPSMVS
eukprot:3927233-Amphidinium_carterae.1